MPETNTARDAALYELRVQAGDVVVLGTDGLFDNLSDGEVVELTEVLSLGVDAVSLDAVQATADGIATQARAMAQSKTAVTPWSRCAAIPPPPPRLGAVGHRPNHRRRRAFVGFGLTDGA